MLGLAGMPAGAQWVEFEACGFDIDRKDPEVAELRHFVRAPNLGRFAIWGPAVSVIAEMRVPEGAKRCTGIYIGAHQWLVIGDYAETHCKLKPGGPYCKKPR